MFLNEVGRPDLAAKSNLTVKDLATMLYESLQKLKKLDNDKDGRVSFDDWSTSIKKEPLMMEAFGPCLPTERASNAFMRKVEAEYGETKRL